MIYREAGFEESLEQLQFARTWRKPLIYSVTKEALICLKTAQNSMTS